MSVDAVAGPPQLEGIDLSDRDFWVRPPAERHAVFDLLRRESPFAFFAEPVVPYIPAGPGYHTGNRPGQPGVGAGHSGPGDRTGAVRGALWRGRQGTWRRRDWLSGCAQSSFIGS